jgi:hypothetical protein
MKTCWLWAIHFDSGAFSADAVNASQSGRQIARLEKRMRHGTGYTSPWRTHSSRTAQTCCAPFAAKKLAVVNGICRIRTPVAS